LSENEVESLLNIKSACFLFWNCFDIFVQLG